MSGEAKASAATPLGGHLGGVAGVPYPERSAFSADFACLKTFADAKALLRLVRSHDDLGKLSGAVEARYVNGGTPLPMSSLEWDDWVVLVARKSAELSTGIAPARFGFRDPGGGISGIDCIGESQVDIISKADAVGVALFYEYGPDGSIVGTFRRYGEKWVKEDAEQRRAAVSAALDELSRLVRIGLEVSDEIGGLSAIDRTKIEQSMRAHGIDPADEAEELALFGVTERHGIFKDIMARVEVDQEASGIALPVLSSLLSGRWAKLDARDAHKLVGRGTQSDLRRHVVFDAIAFNMRRDSEYKRAMFERAEHIAALASQVGSLDNPLPRGTAKRKLSEPVVATTAEDRQAEQYLLTKHRARLPGPNEFCLGPIIEVTEKYVVQSLGRGIVVIHRRDRLAPEVIEAGRIEGLTVVYRNSRVAALASLTQGRSFER